MVFKFNNPLNEANKTDSRKKIPAIMSVVIGLASTAFYIHADLQSISHSTSSTAAIGYIFIPFVALFYFICFSIFGYCVGMLTLAAISKEYRQKRYVKLLLAGLTAICYITVYTVNSLQTYACSEKINQILAATSSAQIDDIYSDMTRGSYHGFSFPILHYYQIYIIQALAESPYTSTTVLDKLARSGNSRLSERIGGPRNRKGFSAARLICFNKNTSVATLIYLIETEGKYTLQDSASRAVEIKNWEIANKIYEVCKNDKTFHCNMARSRLQDMNNKPQRTLPRPQSPRIIDRTFVPVN